MNISLAHVVLLLICQVGSAQEWNNPPASFLRKVTSGVVFPRIDYKSATGVEVLEFIRLKIWDTNFVDQEAARPAFEYRCNPRRLLKDVNIQRKNITCADALNEVCDQLGLGWMIERGKIVFTEAKAQEEKSEQGASIDRHQPHLSNLHHDALARR